MGGEKREWDGEKNEDKLWREMERERKWGEGIMQSI